MPDLLTVSSDTRARIARLHPNDGSQPFKHHAVLAVLIALLVLAYWTWSHGLWPLTVAAWLLAAQLAHNKSIVFHEVAHGTFHTNRYLNEFFGIWYGSLILVPLSVYRCAHGEHHARLAGPEDPELWPFVDVRKPRWFRLAATVLELGLGYFYTPLLFVRAIVVGRHKVPRRLWPRIAGEYLFCLGLWGTTLAGVHALDGWEVFAVAWLVPICLASDLETLNKYVQHMGLFGNTALTSTRTVAPRRRIGKLFSTSLLHVNYHGTHHRYAKVPYYNLPAATELLHPEENWSPVYASYLRATLDMVASLPNPRIGRQWLEAVLGRKDTGGPPVRSGLGRTGPG